MSFKLIGICEPKMSYIIKTLSFLLS